MFPLGSVLFPTMVLPLHVFEDRYRAMAADCLAGDGEFGVCLIERGFEVGGGDVRSDVGTVARIVGSQQFDDGRWALATVGVRRIRIVEWLDDDPYPRADVEDWPDPEPVPDLTHERSLAVSQLRAVLGLMGELGIAGPPDDVAIEDDPVPASHQVATLSPLGAYDRQRLLAAASTADRLSMLIELLAQAETDLRTSRGRD